MLFPAGEALFGAEGDGPLPCVPAAEAGTNNPLTASAVRMAGRRYDGIAALFIIRSMIALLLLFCNCRACARSSPFFRRHSRLAT